MNGWLSALAWVVLALVLRQALMGARWRRLADDGLMHPYFASTVILMVMWTLKASVDAGLGFHFVGATLLTLMFGWRLALLAAFVALLGSYITLGGDPQVFAVNLLLKSGFPILVSHGLLRLVQRRLPHHVFVYIFVNGFFGAALAVLAQVTGIALVLAMTGAYAAGYLVSDYLAFAPLMMFGEAWITGMLVAIFVSYWPALLSTFDDRSYLTDKTP
ncbi:MAG: energy-coupling factor ABC transporter permease [Gammaproteobacteria bacterium]|nr:energy-coupling factor ABC transporter permease [Gammaproteobacteria bacterium]